MMRYAATHDVAASRAGDRHVLDANGGTSEAACAGRGEAVLPRRRARKSVAPGVLAGRATAQPKRGNSRLFSRWMCSCSHRSACARGVQRAPRRAGLSGSSKPWQSPPGGRDVRRARCARSASADGRGDHRVPPCIIIGNRICSSFAMCSSSAAASCRAARSPAGTFGCPRDAAPPFSESQQLRNSRRCTRGSARGCDRSAPACLAAPCARRATAIELRLDLCERTARSPPLASDAPPQQ